MARWEKAELERADDRGHWRGWGVHSYAVRGGWIYVGKKAWRIYAPSEHPELPSQFASLAGGDPKRLERFLDNYGHLGYLDLVGKAKVGGRWPHGKPAEWPMQSGEPLEWVWAHARTVAWALKAARTLKAAGRQNWKALWSAFPEVYGLGCFTERLHDAREVVATGATTTGHSGLIALQPSFDELPKRKRIGNLLGDLLMVNLRGVHRRIEWREDGLTNYWADDTLLESIYTIVADAATGGRLMTCAAPDCGAVFIQTDARQKYCPKRSDQLKSNCATRTSARSWRAGNGAR